MGKAGFVLVLVLVTAFALVTLAISAQPVGKIKLDLTGKKSSDFDHTAHEKVVESCQKCHHKDAAGTEQKCLKCHTVEGTDKVIKAKDAFHKQCAGCHKSIKKGPKSCKGCHQPKES